MLSLTHTALSLRPVTPADDPLLELMYASTREKEMALLTGWSQEQKAAFLQQQFRVQQAYYREHYHNTFFWLILHRQEPVGRLYLAPEFGDGTIRIVDITLLPAWRNKGLGGSLLKDILQYAAHQKKNVTIHVESFNPALQLYERLGFRLKDRKNEVYLLYEWPFGSTAAGEPSK